MWYNNAIFYQIYPLGMCGAPAENTWNWSVWNGAAAPVNRIARISKWIPHFKQTGITAVYFSPIFQSDRHGYDTRDYYTVDSRLGSNEDFAAVCRTLHDAGIKVVVDGVFNHVGRGFWAFRDVQKNRQQSPYKDWFFIDWNRQSDCGDTFWYEGWEGHYDLVKLNLDNQAVREHLFGAVQAWEEQFDIDGIRLDVAYCLPVPFIQQLRVLTDELGRKKKKDIVLIGEIIKDDYGRIAADKLHSCTDYECYKGIYSSLNELNLFEIAWSFNRLFGQNGICHSTPLFNFVDNHDVDRIASILRSEALLPLAYGLLFAMPGTPCIYYGSEWGLRGKKADGDSALRPAVESPYRNQLTEFIERCAQARREREEIRTGTYRQLFLTNGQFLFERAENTTRTVVAVNTTETPFTVHICSASYAHFDGLFGVFRDILTGESIRCDGTVTLPPLRIMYLVEQ